MRLEGAKASVRVWDVTDPLRPVALTVASADGAAVWTNPFMGERRYVAWNGVEGVATPAFEGTVTSQNLHGSGVRPDMVIIAPHELIAAARRVAALHERTDSLSTLVVDQQQIFNEFSSGTAHPAAFRHFLKMLYDRGKGAGRPLRYALMMGRGCGVASAADAYMAERGEHERARVIYNRRLSGAA